MGYNNVDVMVSGPNKPSSTYKTKILKGNQSFASQVTEANTKYVIKYDFDLGGESVTIPEGCLLEFDGGAISNGTLVGQSTILIYNQPLNNILTTTLEGTWRHESGVKADEEDITDLNGELKFKDKAYVPANYSGLGKKILRKNMVSGVNTLTQNMINQANTIYVIQYDFTLGEDITIPANCVFQFEGGSISAGSDENMSTITGTNTELKAELVKIFGADINIAGTWTNNNSYIQWFDNNIDKIDACATISRIVWLKNKGNYTITTSVKCKGGFVLEGNESTITVGNITHVDGTSVFSNKYLFWIREVNNVSIKNVHYIVNGGTSNINTVIGAYLANNLSFVNVTIDILDTFRSVLVTMDFYGGVNNVLIDGCVFNHVNDVSAGGLWVRSFWYATTNIIITNSQFINKKGDEVLAIFSNDTVGSKISDVIVKNCVFTNIVGNYNAAHLLRVFNKTSNVRIENCTFNGNYKYTEAICGDTDYAIVNDCIFTIDRVNYSSNKQLLRMVNATSCIFNDSSTSEEESYTPMTIKECNIKDSKFYSDVLFSYSSVYNCNFSLEKLNFEWCIYIIGNHIIKRGTTNITCKIQGTTINRNCEFIENTIILDDNTKLITFIGTDSEQRLIEVVSNVTNGVLDFDNANYKYNIINNTAYRYKFKEYASNTNIKFRDNIALAFATFGSTRPNYLVSLNNDSPYNYSSFFDTTLGKYIYAKKVGNGVVNWIDEKGYTAAINKGTTAQRPTSTLTTSDVGYQYFDTDLGKPIYLKVDNTGTSESPVWVKSWVDATGATV